MLRTRLWVGSLLLLATGGVLLADSECEPYYPFLLACVLAIGIFATRELLTLMPANSRPRSDIATFGVLLVVVANWWSTVERFGVASPLALRSPWEASLYAFFVIILSAFLVEMATYRAAGGSIPRVANTIFTVAYLGLLASCLIRIRFDVPESGLALAAAILVPKVGDIGAYLVGRIFGRHKFTPLLSPKKTWEGFVGGLLFAVGMAVGISYAGPVFRLGLGHAVAFGMLVGIAGVLGDLAESMIKRDALSKDASQAIPGFGGILDVIDSVLFAAPVAYLLLRI
jgi:phosphatidate cytidylyltransferase